MTQKKFKLGGIKESIFNDHTPVGTNIIVTFNMEGEIESFKIIDTLPISLEENQMCVVVSSANGDWDEVKIAEAIPA